MRSPDRVGNEGNKDVRFPISGSFEAPMDGTLQLDFNNSYSRLRRKVVEYTVKIEKSNSNLEDDDDESQKEEEEVEIET